MSVFHELQSNIHRIQANMWHEVMTCTWNVNITWMSLHVHELQMCDMNVTTCTWIANMGHECHYMYMNCKATSTEHTQTCDINILGSQTGQSGHIQPSFPNTTFTWGITTHLAVSAVKTLTWMVHMACTPTSMHTHTHTHWFCVQQTTPVFTIFVKVHFCSRAHQYIQFL